MLKRVSFVKTASDNKESDYRKFSRDVIADMLVDENKRSLISFSYSSTRSHTFIYCYWCLWRLVENVL